MFEDILIIIFLYVVIDFEVGCYVILICNFDYWGKDLFLCCGINNFDMIQIEYYGDGDVFFEVFKVGEVFFVCEFNVENWVSCYNFFCVEVGDVVKFEIIYEKFFGIIGFVMNICCVFFDDICVCDVLMYVFNFEFVNDVMIKGCQLCIISYFSNLVLFKQDGFVIGCVVDYFVFYVVSVLVGMIEGYVLFVFDGFECNCVNVVKVMDFLMLVGFIVENGVMIQLNGEFFVFEILMK